MLDVIRRKPLIGFFVGLGCSLVVMALSVPLISRPPLDPAQVGAYSIQELIDALPNERGADVGKESAVWMEPFGDGQDSRPIDLAPKRKRAAPVKPVMSPVMLELVRRGVRALPELIEHLNDVRPTEFVVHNDDEHPLRHGDEYDPRRTNPWRAPAGVNTLPDTPIERRIYRLKVGDLCFVAIGQIVNRRLEAARWQPTGTVINSPVETASLAVAVKRDWGNLTTAEHEQALIEDVVTHPEVSARAALDRLRFYYPEAHTAYLLEARLLAVSAVNPEHGFACAVRYRRLAEGVLVTRRPARTMRERWPRLGQFAKLNGIND